MRASDFATTCLLAVGEEVHLHVRDELIAQSAVGATHTQWNFSNTFWSSPITVLIVCFRLLRIVLA